MRVNLVAMPWSSRTKPSAALSALAVYLRAHLPEVLVRTWSEFVEASELIGEDDYEAIAEDCYATGEPFYSCLLYPECVESARAAFVESRLQQTAVDAGQAETWGRRFDAIRAVLAAHASALADDLAQSSDVVGFTCSFGQLFASVYLARLVKAKNPACKIVLGGPSVSSAAGPSLLREYPFVDYVIRGEGERTLLSLVQALIDNAPVPRQILSADNLAASSGFEEVSRLDDLPLPDYDEYAERAERHGIGWFLPIEGSRGCWWDRVGRSNDPTQTCYFCNLNMQWSGYREKSIQRVVSELEELSSRHHVARAFFVDNIIRHKGAEELGNAIKDLGRDFEIFYEARANLRPHELLAMWEAGLRVTQFGIESLSTTVLKKIGKGTTALQNLEAMRLLTELEIKHNANLIFDFPGTTADDVVETVRAIENLAVSFEPLSPVRFYLGRSSTVDRLRERFGVRNVRNREQYLAGLPRAVWERLELLELDYDLDQPAADWNPAREAVARWQANHRGLSEKLLVYRDCVEFVVIEDRRGGALRSGSFDGIYRELYVECLQARTFEWLRNRFPETSEKEIQEALLLFVEDSLMACEGDRYLSLAVATAPHIAAVRIRKARQAEQAVKAGRRSLPLVAFG
jgi:ribosomal peptide maturation radical SAM protein 1